MNFIWPGKPIWPTALSMLRLLSALMLAWQLYQYHLLIALVLVCLAILSDLADGYLARRLKCETIQGAWLDVSADFLLISTNTYWWTPDLPTRRYLKKLELNHTASFVLVSASGQAERSLQRTQFLLEQAGGKVIQSLALFTWRPNDESQLSRPNKELAQEIAYHTALTLELP